MTHIRIEGPYYGSYSLAIVNRALIYGLSKIPGVKVSYSPTKAEEYKRDNQTELSLENTAQYIDVRTNISPDIVIRNTWPVESSDLKGKNNYRIFAWEETKIPVEIVEQLNKFYDAVIATSKFVENVLKINNIKNVIEFTHSSTLLDYLAHEISLDKKGDIVRYLHISSCIPRKAPEILCDAFGEAFGKTNNSKLIIKTGWNPHINIHRLVSDTINKYDLLPDSITIINNEMTDYELARLIDESDYHVYPSRGEGFGLPILEAHLFGKPCLMTINSSLSELYLSDVDIMIESELTYSKSHFNQLGSLWWEPNKNSLVEAFLRSYDEHQNSYNNYIEKVKKLNNITWPSWDEVALDLYISLRSFQKYKVTNINKDLVKGETNMPLVMITTYNIMCGIAAYSEKIIRAWHRTFGVYPIIISSKTGQVLNVEASVENNNSPTIHRSWIHWGGLGDALEHIPKNSLVMIQHHTAFYSTQDLKALIDTSLDRGCSCIVELHSVLDDSHDPGCYKRLVLSYSDKDKVLFLVHSYRELEQLDSRIDSANKIRLYSHPLDPVSVDTELRPEGNSYLVAAFGFLRSHKRFDIILDAMHILRHRNNIDARLIIMAAITDSPDSQKTLSILNSMINAYGLTDKVLIHTQFLDESVVKAVLGYVDAVVFPYDDVPEGASGAVRVAISAGAAIVCSNAPMFDEFTNNVIRFDSVENLADHLTTLIINRPLREQYRRLSKELCQNDYGAYVTYLNHAFKYLLNRQN